MAMTQEQYLDVAVKLLPVGLAWKRALNIPINFWTAMPNKVTEVRAYSLVGSQPNIIANTEAAEWIVDWALQYQNNSRSYAFINASRFRGGSDELVDLYVVVEGY